MLAICGREADAELVLGSHVSGGNRKARSADSSHPIDTSGFQMRPWRETLAKIAAHERLIVIMEAHNAPKHRQWIEQTLSILQTAGFATMQLRPCSNQEPRNKSRR
jgi:hypothetical protein